MAVPHLEDRVVPRIVARPGLSEHGALSTTGLFRHAQPRRIDVRPKQPFLDWASRLDDSGIVPDAEFESDREASAVLKEVYPEIFERELYGWHTDESAWPQNRTLKMFRERFEIELYSVVEDLAGDDLIDDEE